MKKLSFGCRFAAVCKKDFSYAQAADSIKKKKLLN
jgi:hypothetical protein